MSDVEQIIKGITESLTLKIKEEVYEQTKNKDEEVSGLHRQINDKLSEQGTMILAMKDTVDSHHAFIQEMRTVIKTGGYIKKFILWILVFVPTFAGFIGGLKYIYDWVKNN